MRDPGRICGLASALDEMETTLDMYADPAPRFNKERLALLREVDDTWRYIQVKLDSWVLSKHSSPTCHNRLRCHSVSALIR